MRLYVKAGAEADVVGDGYVTAEEADVVDDREVTTEQKPERETRVSIVWSFIVTLLSASDGTCTGRTGAFSSWGLISTLLRKRGGAPSSRLWPIVDQVTG